MTGICGAFDNVDALHSRVNADKERAEKIFGDEFFHDIESPYHDDVDEVMTTLETAVDLLAELCAVLEIDRDDSFLEAEGIKRQAD